MHPFCDNFLIYHINDEQSDHYNIELHAPEEDRDYLEAQAGDHLFCPFECEFCTFHWLKGWPPFEKDKTDVLPTYLH
jgi:hypothetical protein